jgi:hypothetical protein
LIRKQLLLDQSYPVEHVLEHVGQRLLEQQLLWSR